MKKYKQPKIERILLDSKQAILQTCQNGGAYFVTTVSDRCFTAGIGPACGATIKGKGLSMGFSYTPNALPS